MKNTLGSRIKHLRENNNINQLELANKLNISNTTLSQYESGKRMPSDEIKSKLADFFNTTVDYLLGRTDNPHNSNKKDNLHNENIEYDPIDIEIADRIMKKLVEKKVFEDKDKIKQLEKIIDALYDEYK